MTPSETRIMTVLSLLAWMDLMRSRNLMFSSVSRIVDYLVCQ